MTIYQQLFERLDELNRFTKAIHDIQHERPLPQINHRLKRARQRLYFLQIPLTLVLTVLYIYYSHYSSGFLEDRVMAIRSLGLLSIGSLLRLIYDVGLVLKLKEQKFIAELLNN